MFTSLFATVASSDPTLVETIVLRVNNLIADFGMNLIAALAILLIGLFISKLICKAIGAAMGKKEIDATVTAFVTNLIYMALATFVIIAAVGRLGVPIAGFAAVLAAAGLAIGLALQGSLSNFAAGVMIIIFRPFKADDFVSVAGEAGIVEKVEIFTTTMRTPDNKVIIVPNGAVLGGPITNFTGKDTRRIDFTFGIGYGDDIAKAKKVIMDIFEADERILKDPAPTVGVVEHGDSSINLAARPWVTVPEYWNVYFDVMEKVKVAFDEEGISIPFPQRDVHLFQEK